MASIRHALVFASAGRYTARAVNLLMTVVLSRLIGPKEFGVAVLGISAFMILDAIRELASANYLVQQAELDDHKIDTAFTVSLSITVALAATAVIAAEPIARLYGEPRLASYIHVVAAAFAVGPFMQPIYALWSRRLAFRRVAAMDVLQAVVNAVASVTLVSLGFGYLGIAWGTAIAAVSVVIVGGWLSRHDLRRLRLSLREWRGVLAFGLYGSATAIIYRVAESVSYLIFGRLLGTQAVGLLQRAGIIATFPDSVVLAGVGAVALPAFSHHAREGTDLRRAYLTAVSQVSAIQWPALALIATLATPMTLLLLGPQWSEVAPLVQILACALLFNFAVTLNFPVLVAVGAIRRTAPVALLQAVISLTVVVWAARHGLRAVALSGLLTVPLGLVLWTTMVRREISFTVREFLGALRKSAVVLVASAAGPLSILWASGGAPSLQAAGLAAALWLLGWFAAIRLTHHPLLVELQRARVALVARFGR